MNLNTMFPSSWLKKEDVQQPMTVAIKHVVMDEVNTDGGKEQKPVLHFVGNVKPMILNRGNAETIAAMYGDDTNAWPGKSIEIYFDPSVMFGGKRVGGIRVRQPSNAFAAQQTTANGHATAAGPLWDLSDGSAAGTRVKLSTEQVRDFLADTQLELNQIKVKPAGTGRDRAVTADQWQAVNMQQAANDPIPF